MNLAPGMRSSTMLGLCLGLGLGLGLVPPASGDSPPPAGRGAFKLEDAVRATGDAVRVQVNRRAVPLQELPVASWIGLPMTGLADVAIDLTVPSSKGKPDYRKATGSIALGCPAGCKLGDAAPRAPGSGTGPAATRAVPPGQVTLDRFAARAELAKGHVKITRWQLASKDLTLEVSLDIQLAADLDDSTIDGCIRFKADPSLAKRDPKTAALIATTGAPLGTDGVYSIKLGGSVGQHRLVGQTCGAAAPAPTRPQLPTPAAARGA